MKNKKLVIIPLLSFCLCACGPKDFEIHTEKQLGYINDADYKNIDKYTSGASISVDPLPNNLGVAKTSKETKIVVSESNDFLKSYELTIPSNVDNYEFFNPKVGTTTYWKQMEGDKELKSGSFVTKETYPRNLYLKGVKNVRDLGFKGFIKQGLIYRGGEFNYCQGSMRTSIKAEGIEMVKNQLGVKTEIDLRNNTEATSSKSAIENLNYVHTPMYYQGSGNVLTLEDPNGTFKNIESVKEVFSVLAKEENYPVYFHCAAGKDRTGLIAYLVEALMGCDETHIYKDFLFSNFVKADNVNLDNILTTYVADINKTTGADLKEKVRNYLVDTVKVSAEDLASLTAILKD